MPSTSINYDEEYKDIELSEMVQIYQHTHNVILCGDMNAFLQRHTCRDRLFQDFVTDNIPKTTEQQSSNDTFFHHNGKHSSKIDYFIVTGNTIPNCRTINTFEMNGLNCSDHTLVSLTFTAKTTFAKLRCEPRKVLTNTKWSECDVISYRLELQNMMNPSNIYNKSCRRTSALDYSTAYLSY